MAWQKSILIRAILHNAESVPKPAATIGAAGSFGMQTCLISTRTHIKYSYACAIKVHRGIAVNDDKAIWLTTYIALPCSYLRICRPARSLSSITNIPSSAPRTKDGKIRPLPPIWQLFRGYSFSMLLEHWLLQARVAQYVSRYAGPSGTVRSESCTVQKA